MARKINPFDVGRATFERREMMSPHARKRIERNRKRRKPGGRPDVQRSKAAVYTKAPIMTPAIAEQFVKVLAAGISTSDALAYFAPDHFNRLVKEEREDWARDWATHDMVIRALNKFNGGAWEDLDKDKRIDLGLDRAMAGLAYFLYTHDYSTVDGTDLKKHDAARKDILDYLKARTTGDEEAPWMVAMRQIVEGTLKSGMPPTLTTIPTPSQKES